MNLVGESRKAIAGARDQAQIAKMLRTAAGALGMWEAGDARTGGGPAAGANVSARTRIADAPNGIPRI
jgi:hypothetical protein